MNYRYVLIVSTILFIFSIGAISAADLNKTSHQTLNVDQDTSIPAIVGSSIAQGTFEDLQKEIDNAPAKSILILDRDYNAQNGATIKCDKSLTINGNGHTIDCLGKYTAFHSTSGWINLKNLNIINGHSEGSGGAICAEGTSRYLLLNCTLSNNWAKGLGGAIFAQNSIKILDSTLNGNTAKIHGGAIYCPDMIVSNSKFNQNHADAYGGAIFCLDMIVSNSKFNLNEATNGQGGAIYTRNINVYNSIITNSHSGGCGGAIFSEGPVNLENSQLLYNKADAKGKTCSGGAICTIADAIITNSTLVGNYALTYGGAILAQNVMVDFNKNGKYKSEIRDNHASRYGGAIYSLGNTYLEGTTLTYNTAYYRGGAIYCTNAEVRKSTVSHNQAQESSGGGIDAENNVIIDGSTFSNNFAQNSGGAIVADTVTFKNGGLFYENKANYDRGGAIWTSKITNSEVTGVTFCGNAAGEGMIEAESMGEDYGCYGGALYIYKETEVTFNYCSFLGNYALEKGGAIYMDSTSSKLTLKNNVFAGNYVPTMCSGEGSCVYTCGKFTKINNNYWCGNNPTSDNSELIEWRFLIPNKHHTDENPATSSPF